MMHALPKNHLSIPLPNHPLHPSTFYPQPSFLHSYILVLVRMEMQRWFLAREETEVWGGEGECYGVGEGAVGEGGKEGGYGPVEAGCSSYTWKECIG